MDFSDVKHRIFYYYGRDPEVAGGGAVNHSDPDVKAATEERNNNK